MKPYLNPMSTPVGIDTPTVERKARRCSSKADASSTSSSTQLPKSGRIPFRIAPQSARSTPLTSADDTTVTLWIQADDFQALDSDISVPSATTATPPKPKRRKNPASAKGLLAPSTASDEHTPASPPLSAQASQVGVLGCQVKPSSPGQEAWQPLLPPCPRDEHAPHPYIILGFDTEYTTPGALNFAQIKEGLGKVDVLSYQFYAITSEGHQWQGICLPDAGERLTCSQLLTFALGMGSRLHGLCNLPRDIVLVGHFTRADIPTFADFGDLQNAIDALRGSFVTLGSANTSYRLPCASLSATPDHVDIRLHLRDTLLLTPQASKSLKEIGKLIGIPKVELSEDPKEQLYRITHMDEVRARHWPLFRRYALADAEICAHYMRRIIRQNREVTGEWKLPVTLTSIGIDLLLKHWDDQGLNKNDLLGKELCTERTYSKLRQCYEYRQVEVLKEALSLHETLITESYHGGRNEQHWFGPGFEDTWTDFDLSSAYPTAMSAILEPDWDNIRLSQNVADYTPDVLGFALVEYAFPSTVRYPTMPQRTEHGIVFARRGRAYCAAPEIHLARLLKAELRIVHGVIVPYKSDRPIFADFIRSCVNKRIQCGKNTLEGLFWKEISNSTYGKLAQGLRKKRVYDLRSRDTKPLPPSKITNCAFAAYTTSFTRAVLGEVMNAIPPDKIVFSCTTDGFITNATADDLAGWHHKGHFANYFALQREILVNDDTVLEKKHQIRQPLGWRTRGQATLKQGDQGGESPIAPIILAKAGLSTPPDIDGTTAENNHIVQLFFNRFSGQITQIYGYAGLREMIEYQADFVEKTFTKKLSMEYDWKRRPSSLGYSDEYQHIAFATVPWDSVAQYQDVREIWDRYNETGLHCIKTQNDFLAWAHYLEDHTFMEPHKRKYLHKADGGIKRLRQQLCAAFKSGAVGVRRESKISNCEFAALLRQADIPCTLEDVKNGKRMAFKYNHCPSTPRVIRSLSLLKQQAFADLEIEQLIDNDYIAHGITLSTLTECEFTLRVNHPDGLPVVNRLGNSLDSATATVHTKRVNKTNLAAPRNANAFIRRIELLKQTRPLYVGQDWDDLDDWQVREMVDKIREHDDLEMTIEHDQQDAHLITVEQEESDFNVAHEHDGVGVVWVEGDEYIKLDVEDDMKARQASKPVVQLDNDDDFINEWIELLGIKSKHHSASQRKH